MGSNGYDGQRLRLIVSRSKGEGDTPMEWSAEHVNSDQPDQPEPTAQLSSEATEFDPTADAYADAELERRRTRTEAMIAKARRLT